MAHAEAGTGVLVPHTTVNAHVRELGVGCVSRLGSAGAGYTFFLRLCTGTFWGVRERLSVKFQAPIDLYFSYFCL